MSLTLASVARALLDEFQAWCPANHPTGGRWKSEMSGLLRDACAAAEAHRREFPRHAPFTVVYPCDDVTPNRIECRTGKRGSEVRDWDIRGPTKSEAVAALRPLRPQLDACRSPTEGEPRFVLVMALFTIRSNGTVAAVKATPWSSVPLPAEIASCVEGVLSAAHFPAFAGEPVDFQFPVFLHPR